MKSNDRSGTEAAYWFFAPVGPGGYWGPLLSNYKYVQKPYCCIW